MQEKIFELSSRYRVLPHDRGFVIYPLVLNAQGTYQHGKPHYVGSMEDVVHYLSQCELSNEEMQSLQGCEQALKGIYAELKDLRQLACGEIY